MVSNNYLIIGGSSGIGYEIAQLLLKENHKVWITGNTSESTPLGAIRLQLDIQNYNPQVFDSLPDTLHGIAYCPGTIQLKPFRALKEEDFKKDMEINVWGAVKTLQDNLKRLKQATSASVVLFSTVAVQTGMSFHSSVAASKGAIEGLTRSLAAELAPSIRVNAVAPSLTDTALASALLSTPEKREASAKRHPLQRVASAEEIAQVAHFLLSEKSNWVTGQIWKADGGMGNLK
ncbi:SDR family oxidoreductase [Cytophagales bacterium LB-30]|uniref:SDR family oxidoreductase n=1 Tax=Shiella aurantiaca TaxID=3058365 RepID=A0ABT8F4F9_9BACT|nr:SDR family oxidoreductase [Shiella aurantiaca]MDN4165331.1 SDR family oxidoreductase [Shiella aurantiaca]